MGALPGSSLSLHNLPEAMLHAGTTDRCEVRGDHLSLRTEAEEQAGLGVGWRPSSYHIQTAARKRQSGHRADAQQARGQRLWPMVWWEEEMEELSRLQALLSVRHCRNRPVSTAHQPESC